MFPTVLSGYCQITEDRVTIQLLAEGQIMVAVFSAIWLGGATAVFFTLVRLYNALLLGPADTSAALRAATISSAFYWSGVLLAFAAAFALGKYAPRAAMSFSLGLALFVALGFIKVVVGSFRGSIEPSHATGLSAVLAAIVWNPVLYLVFIGCLLAGIAIVGRRPITVP